MAETSTPGTSIEAGRAVASTRPAAARRGADSAPRERACGSIRPHASAGVSIAQWYTSRSFRLSLFPPMPIYEYVCEKCGQSMEAIQRLSDPPLEVCEKCGGRLRKKVSAPAFQFKGTGWYVTDYARKGDSGKSSSSS